jgi:hypothetical protein
MDLGSTQPLTEMSTRNLFPGGKGWLVCGADNLTARAFFFFLEKEVPELTRGKDKHTESFVTISLYNITVYFHIL